MSKTTGSSVASASRVDDDEVVGDDGGAGAENGGSIVEQKVSSITSDNWLDSRGDSYKGPRRVCQLRGRILSHTGINMPTDSSDHLSHPQVLPSFLTGSRTDPFGCVSIIEASITSR